MSDPSDPFPLLEHMTVRHVREYLVRRRSIILPIGIIEQHGYHLPLNTDALIAHHLACRAGQRTGTLVAPTITQSFSGGGLPGTINISPAVMSLVVSETLLSLVSQGFRKCYLLLCHGGTENTRALTDTLKILLRTNPAFAETLLALFPVWQLSSPGQGWSLAIREHDWHAGWLETSMVMALEPQLVRMQDMQLDPPPVLAQLVENPDHYQQAEQIVDHPFAVPRISQRPDVTVGVLGDPRRASAEQGRQIVDDIVNNLCRHIERIDGDPATVYHRVPFVPEPLAITGS